MLPRFLQKRVENSLISLALLVLFLTFAIGVYRGGVQLVQLRAETLTLQELPWALLLSLFRILASYSASLLFAFSLGLLAARTRLGERLILPTLDILQSIPVIAFFPAAISVFIGVSNGHRMGIELAAIFLIFTSQAWNMAFSVYESTKTIPQDNLDAIASFGVKGTARFWKLYAPAAVPRLVYNSILSWSNGWYFLVACEIIAFGNIKYYLPGIGTFLAQAAEQDQLRLVLSGIAALAALILLFDALVWRPVSVWAEKFRQDYSSSGGEASPQFARMFPFASRMAGLSGRLKPVRKLLLRMLRALFFPLSWLVREILIPLLWDLPLATVSYLWHRLDQLFLERARSTLQTLILTSRRPALAALGILGMLIGLWVGSKLFYWLQPPWPAMAREIPLAVLRSTLRLLICLGVSLVVVVPTALLSYGRPNLRRWMMTLSQLGASLPAIALFPLLILVFVQKLGGGMELASILLLLTGMLWYLLFNALGGVAVIPADLSDAARALGLQRWTTWKRLVIPAMRPALITGMITAWGGGWNALVVSEYVNFKGEAMTVQGIGALLNRAVYQQGDPRAIMLCIGGMVAWILILNTLIWRPLYQDAADRYKFDS
jgi:NitT/TauT family transport system permease protein